MTREPDAELVSACREWLLEQIPHGAWPMADKLAAFVRSRIEQAKPKTPYEIAPHTIVFTPETLDKYLKDRIEQATADEAEYWAKGHICQNSRDCPECTHLADLRRRENGR